MRRTFLVLGAMAGGCGGESTSAVDAGSDVRADATVSDVSTDGAADAMVCDVGAAPSAMLPMIRSTVRIVDDDAGVSSPTPAGGDPTGRWVMTAATLYLPALARGQVVTETTTLTGTGWGVIEGTSYRINTSLDLALDTVMIGLVRRPVGLGSRGAFTLRGGTFDLAPVCSTSQGSMGAMQTLGFSRDSMDRARLHAESMGMFGRLVIVFDLERVQ